MVKKFRDLFGKLFRRGKKPAMPKKPVRRSLEALGGGHRGIAAGNLKKPDLSLENVRKWHTITADEAEGFVYDQEPLFVHSTNVSMLQYFIDDHKLMVQFHNGASYLYDNVTEDEAILFAKAQSKGGAVWDILRVRGSRTQHKKPYTKGSAGYRPPQAKEEILTIDGQRVRVIREGNQTRYELLDEG